jgi:hypothetical protein
VLVGKKDTDANAVLESHSYVSEKPWGHFFVLAVFLKVMAMLVHW